MKLSPLIIIILLYYTIILYYILIYYSTEVAEEKQTAFIKNCINISFCVVCVICLFDNSSQAKEKLTLVKVRSLLGKEPPCIIFPSDPNIKCFSQSGDGSSMCYQSELARATFFATLHKHPLRVPLMIFNDIEHAFHP